METFKKKDIKQYKKTPTKKVVDTEIDEVEEIDELVNSMGGGISGDKPSANNSEIETAPQATTDDFVDAAIQPNRRLFNVGGAQYSRGVDFSGNESIDALAKNKLIKLLEDMGNTLDNNENLNDINQNEVPDIKELPSNVASKLTMLVDTVDKNNLTGEQITIILVHFLSKVSDRLESEQIQLIKNKF
jgi:hypothetical protein